MILLPLLAACTALAPPDPSSPNALAREESEAESPPPTPPIEPSCDARPAVCDPLDVDATRCIDEPGLFTPVMAQGLVVDARLNHDVLAELALAPGRWHVRYTNESAGDCQEFLRTFHVSDAALVAAEPRRSYRPSAPAGERAERTDVPGGRAWSPETVLSLHGGAR